MARHTTTHARRVELRRDLRTMRRMLERYADELNPTRAACDADEASHDVRAAFQMDRARAALDAALHRLED